MRSKDSHSWSRSRETSGPFVRYFGNFFPLVLCRPLFHVRGCAPRFVVPPASDPAVDNRNDSRMVFELVPRTSAITSRRSPFRASSIAYAAK